MVTWGTKSVRTSWSWRRGGSDFAALYLMEAASRPHQGTPTASQVRDHRCRKGFRTLACLRPGSQLF